MPDRPRVIARSGRTADLAPSQTADADLAAAVPWLAADDIVAFLSVVVRTGVPDSRPVDVPGVGVHAISAARVGDAAVLIVCHPDLGAGADPESRLEQLAKVGTWRWDAPHGRILWSPEALRIIQASESGSQTAVHGAPYTVHPDDAEAERRFMQAVLVEGAPAETEFRILHGGGEPTRVRLAAEAAGGPGQPGPVQGVIQDITAWRRAETALEVARVQLAARRSRADAEHHLASALQQAVVPSAVRNQPVRAGVDFAARYRPASATAGVGGDWYMVFPLPDDKVLLAIGDVAGHGLPATYAMADLHHGLRGMALAETRPGRLLTLLNKLVDAMPDYTLVSACCLLWDPATRRLSWSNAGHPAPIRITAGGGRVLSGFGGPILGADPDSVYEDYAVSPDRGEVLLLYTDGLVERRRVADDETTAYLLSQAQDPDTDLARYVDRIIAGARSDTDDDVCVVAIRFA